MMTSGTDVLDALVAGVNIVELDPLDTSVGYGGLPNAEGDRAARLVLHARAEEARGRRRRNRRGEDAVAGGLKVMQETDHHLIVGKGAQEFARSMGFKIRPTSTPRPRARRGSNGSAAPIRCTISIRSSARRRCGA